MPAIVYCSHYEHKQALIDFTILILNIIMDIEGIKLFVLAAAKLNISAAGRELGMAPAVASAKLAKLEKGLNAELLHRSTRKVAVSVEGEDFLPYAKEIVAQEKAALAALGMGSSEITGTLRFAAPSTFAQLYIVPILPKFIEQHPEVKLDLRFSDAQFDLIEGSFDLALRNSSLADSSLKGRKLANDKRILCASPDYIAKHGLPEHPLELINHHLISFKNFEPRRLINHQGETGLFDPRAAKNQLVVDDGLNLKLLAVAGAGISVNSIWNAHQELANGSLVRVLPDYQVDADIALWLVYPKSNVLTAKVRAFIDFLTDEIGEQPVWLK